MHRFEELPHTADWSYRAFGRNLGELFENAAFAMFTLEGAVASQNGEIARDVQVAGIDCESLLVNWLNELLYMQEVYREVYLRFAISELSDTSLRAQAFGMAFHHLDKIVKAATFHNLKVESTVDGWQAVLVVDV